jgi:predicted Zn-ribbon and HTH transcriptional regulator
LRPETGIWLETEIGWPQRSLWPHGKGEKKGAYLALKNLKTRPANEDTVPKKKAEDALLVWQPAICSKCQGQRFAKQFANRCPDHVAASETLISNRHNKSYPSLVVTA